jgi:hypothetical protein
MKKALLFLCFVLLVSTAYSQELTLFDRPNTIIILSMPANKEEFNHIFKRAPSPDELNNIVTLLNRYKNLKNVYVIKQPSDLDKMMKILWSNDDKKKYDETFPRIGFSVVGHNDQGNFYFPDGSSMKLEDIEKKFDGVPGMFLSCNAKSYGVNGVDYKLSYSEALNIASNIDDIVTKMHDERRCNIFFDSPRKIATSMIETLNDESRIKYTAKFLGAAGGLTGGFILVKQMDNSTNKQQADNKQRLVKK